MTAAGWIFMLISWTVIIGLFTFCLKRTLRPKANNNSEENTHSPDAPQ